jgi:hypothetical protein
MSCNPASGVPLKSQLKVQTYLYNYIGQLELNQVPLRHMYITNILIGAKTLLQLRLHLLQFSYCLGLFYFYINKQTKTKHTLQEIMQYGSVQEH